MKILFPAAFVAQKVLLAMSFWYHRVVTPRSRRDSIDWVVGPVELASMVHQIALSLPRSVSVAFLGSRYYSYSYDYSPPQKMGKRMRLWHKLVFGPLLLGRLMVEARGFLYVGANGFLLHNVDQRDFEFRFLKRRGRRIGVYWCGSEIRSPKLMHELEQRMGLPNVFTYMGQVSARFETPAHEAVLRKRADSANRYADVMFDVPTDQTSYLVGHREPFFYFLAPSQFVDDTRKFDDLSRIVITHASTSPIIKGTQLVRAAIAKLVDEGYDFEYVELIRTDSATVAEQLARSHIALNQFYGFSTTVFGAEALAARCAVLSSADGTIETNLAPGANDASLVTKHWQVYDNLKSLLDHPDRIEPLATAGQDWARRYSSTENAGALLTGILDSVLGGNYRREERALLTPEQLFTVTPDGNPSTKEPTT